jgi:Rieske Fe-S protein
MTSQGTATKSHSASFDGSTVRTTTSDSRSDDCGDVPQTSRRGFCNGLLLTSAALVIAAKGAASETAAQADVLANPLMKIQGAEALMPGSSILFNYPTRNDPSILVRTQEGQYYAYSQKCAHLGCSIHFDRNQRCLQCPCHQGAYDVKNGSVLYGPPQRALDQIFLQMRGGEVWAVGYSSNNQSLLAALKR